MSELAVLRQDGPLTVVCWGELLWDVFPDGPQLGGAAGNVAYHVAALGHHAILVSRVGRDDLGERALSYLERAGVDVSLTQVDEIHPTGTVRVELADGEPRFFIEQESAWDGIQCTAAVAEALGQASALLHGTLAQRRPLGSGALREAVGHLGPGCRRLCDLNLRPPFVDRAAIDSALLGADVVKLTELEAQTLEDRFGVEDAVRWLLFERDVEVVAVTRGARGCRLCTRTEVHDRPGHPIPDPTRGDRVGAGDAFAAVLATELAQGTPLGTVAERANRYAAYVAAQRGAVPPIPPELLAAMHR